MKQVLFKACIVTFISLVASLVGTYVAMVLLLDEPTVAGFVIAAVIPLLVAFPVSYNFEQQRKLLNDAHRELQDAHKQLETMHAEAERKSQLDLMTGISNREHFFGLLKKMRRKSDRGVILIVDADRFKSINDTYGHQTGDRALLAIVAAISGSLRQQDIIGRIGGEEFAVFLSDAQFDEAWLIAERIRMAVEKIVFEPHENVVHPLSISIGGAIAADSDSISHLIHIADARLYEAKRLGRNRVVLQDDGFGYEHPQVALPNSVDHLVGESIRQF